MGSMSYSNPAQRLVDGLGGRTETAEFFDVTTEAVRLWIKNGIPPARALEVEEATRGKSFAVRAKEILEYARQRAPA